MAGNILTKYATSTAPTVTLLQSLVSSQDWKEGWGSATISNATNTYQDYLLGATFTTHASNRQNGQISIYVIGALNDTPLFPIVSSGTLGTEGAISFVDTEERDAICRLLGVLTLDSSPSSIVAFPQTSIAQLFGGTMPTHFVIFVGQNASTTTTTGLASSGSALYLTPTYTQYT